MVAIVSILVKRNPLLKKKLKLARLKQTPEKVIADALRIGLVMALAFTFMGFVFLDQTNRSLGFLPLIFLGSYFLFYKYKLLAIDARIIKRKKLIDRDVLFSGRFLLVKLNSGQPLINALIDASKSEGTSNSYFKEIVEDIQLGKSVENALADASEFSPSDKLKKILFQISNAIRIGIDVTQFLEATLNDIANDQIIEIERYGKKLNSLTLFYMLMGVVVPSLGLTIFVIVFSLANVAINFTFFAIVLGFLAVLQFIFLSIYKSIRPDINI